MPPAESAVISNTTIKYLLIGKGPNCKTCLHFLANNNCYFLNSVSFCSKNDMHIEKLFFEGYNSAQINGPHSYFLFTC